MAGSPRGLGGCSEVTMMGPPLARPAGGKGKEYWPQGSIRREQVAAFRAPGGPSPSPSVTAYPPLGALSRPQGAHSSARHPGAQAG